MIQNAHSIITDLGTIAIVRNAENLSHEIRRGFDIRDQRVAQLRKTDSKRRKQVLKDSVRAIQMASTSTKSQFAADLSCYQPPLDPVVEAEDAQEVPLLLHRMSLEESETMKSIVGNLREGMPVKKLLSIAKQAKDSVEEKEARRHRVEQLLSKLHIDESDPTLQKTIDSVLRENCRLPLPRNPSGPSNAMPSSLSGTEDDDYGSHSEDERSQQSDAVHSAFDDVPAEVVLDFLKQRPLGLRRR